MFKKIKTTLKLFVETNTNKDYQEYQKIQKRWKEKIEKRIQNNAKIIDFTEGALTIKAKKPTWKNELLFMHEEIKKNFQIKTTQ